MRTVIDPDFRLAMYNATRERLRQIAKKYNVPRGRNKFDTIINLMLAHCEGKLPDDPFADSVPRPTSGFRRIRHKK